MRLSGRVQAIERRTGLNGLRRWVRVIQSPGQDRAKAIQQHEAAFGPIGDAGIVLRVIV